MKERKRKGKGKKKENVVNQKITVQIILVIIWKIQVGPKCWYTLDVHQFTSFHNLDWEIVSCWVIDTLPEAEKATVGVN